MVANGLKAKNLRRSEPEFRIATASTGPQVCQLTRLPSILLRSYCDLAAFPGADEQSADLPGFFTGLRLKLAPCRANAYLRFWDV
jgi:hypothetical protein